MFASNVPEASENARLGNESDLPPDYAYDASLLFHRMELHQIDRAGLAERDPPLFRELQALCTLCPSKEQCIFDNLKDAMSETARAYCPNAKTLIALGDRPQKIFLPRTSGDARLGPQQYYYVSSKGGVVPHWWVERRTPQ
jgi:hypothetical protein